MMTIPKFNFNKRILDPFKKIDSSLVTQLVAAYPLTLQILRRQMLLRF